MAWSEISGLGDRLVSSQMKQQHLRREREKGTGGQVSARPKVMQHLSTEECKHTAETTYTA